MEENKLTHIIIIMHQKLEKFDLNQYKELNKEIFENYENNNANNVEIIIPQIDTNEIKKGNYKNLMLYLHVLLYNKNLKTFFKILKLKLKLLFWFIFIYK